MGILLPNRPIETSITLMTRKGKSIPNTQSHEFSPSEISQIPEIERRYAAVKFSTPMNPIYNCHGYTFASRRTGIFDNTALQDILKDDGYTEIRKEDVLPGDIVLYYAPNGDIEHSGIIVEAPDPQMKLPKVASKWGRGKEAIHWLHACPYDVSNVKYYRITKWD